MNEDHIDTLHSFFGLYSIAFAVFEKIQVRHSYNYAGFYI